jgi:hypothetical protein
MTSYPDDNYLFAEGVILERLRLEFPDNATPFIRVDTLGDIQEMIRGNYHFPSVNVVYLGDQPLSQTSLTTDKPSWANTLGNGLASQVTQFWGVVVATKDAKDNRTGVASRVEAGKIILRVLKALQGFAVMEGRRLIRAPFQGQTSLTMSGHSFLTVQFNLILDILGGP